MVYSVSDLESMQTRAVTRDFSILDGSGVLTEERYRGVLVYDLFTDIGIKNNAGDVTVLCGGRHRRHLLPFPAEKAELPQLCVSKPGASWGHACIRRRHNRRRDHGRQASRIRRALSPATTPLIKTPEGRSGLSCPRESEDAVNADLCVKNVVAIEITANDIDTGVMP